MTGNMVRVEMTSGDVLAGLADYCREQDPPFVAGAIVSIVGAVDTYTVSTLDPDGSGDDVLHHGKIAEMSGTGEIVGGVAHIHAVFGSDGGCVVASGHLEAAQVAAHFFVRVYVVPLAGADGEP
jgi:predicted DNA-binding protein with PD1-like motif